MTERWVKMVENERLAATVGVPPTKVLRCDDAVKLLARQHRAMRNAVLAYRRKLNYGNVIPGDQHAMGEIDGSIKTCNDILAALAKRGGGK